METLMPGTIWKLWEKIVFRFFFILLSLLSLIAYNPLLQALNIGYTQQANFFEHLKGLVTWLDSRIFHLGYLPREHSFQFSDTHFGVILTLTILIIAVIVTAIWTVFDKAKNNYYRLYYWFSNYLAYYIFLAMITYAVYKIIPVQATYPTAPELLSRWGNLRNWEVLFRFMGTSPAYCMFCGWLELIASLLILFNRTRVLGGLLMTVILLQIVCLNIFYNNSIILLSTILLLCNFFIVAKALPKLHTIFIKLKPVSLAQHRYTFSTPWKKYAIILLCLLPAWKVYNTAIESRKYYARQVRNQKKQRLYNVAVYQQENVTIPPVTTDTSRWKYVCFLDYSAGNNLLVKFDMQEKTISYRCKWDSINNKITFISKNDTANENVFYFTVLPHGNMQLKGSWLGKNITMQLVNMPIDSMTLIKDKFLFMQEDQ
jgi:hypothetical protein